LLALLTLAASWPASAAEVRRVEDTLAVPLFSNPEEMPARAAFSPADASLVAVLGDRGELVLIDTSSMVRQWSTAVGSSYDDPLAFSHDGRTVAVRDGNELALVDTFTGEIRRRLDPKIDGLPAPWSIGRPDRIRFQSDDAALLIATNDYLVLADHATGQVLQVFDVDEQTILWDDAKEIGLSQDDRFAYLLTRTHLYTFNVATGETVRTMSVLSALGIDNASNIDNLRITKDGAYTALNIGLFVYIIDNQTERLERRLLAASARINDLTITDDQCCIVTASADGTSRVYEIATGLQLVRLDDTRPENDRVSLSAVASPHRGGVVVTADVDGLLRLWDAGAR
jgi:WD40 repeat protein